MNQNWNKTTTISKRSADITNNKYKTAYKQYLLSDDSNQMLQFRLFQIHTFWSDQCLIHLPADSDDQG